METVKRKKKIEKKERRDVKNKNDTLISNRELKRRRNLFSIPYRIFPNIHKTYNMIHSYF